MNHDKSYYFISSIQLRLARRSQTIELRPNNLKKPTSTSPAAVLRQKKSSSLVHIDQRLRVVREDLKGIVKSEMLRGPEKVSLPQLRQPKKTALE